MVSQNLKDRGVLYVAFGESYRAECLQSIRSLKKIHPILPVCVVTDKNWTYELKPEVVLKRSPILSLKAKPTYVRESPFQETLYLDTDTTIVSPILDVFDLLQYFDIGINFRA